MTDKEKVTVPVPSVGADGEQPLCKNNYKESIADLHTESNLQAADFCDFGTSEVACRKECGQEGLQTVCKNCMILFIRQRHRLLMGWFMQGRICL